MDTLMILLACLTLIAVKGNIKGDYCEVLEEYETFKMTIDSFFASREEICKSKQDRSDCTSIKEEFPDAADGIYRIKPRDGKSSFLAYCDMTQHGGGWLVIQRRKDGSEDFYRTWFEYMDGFGNLTGEFWLGNEKIHRLTSQGNYELRIDLENAKNKTACVEYKHFRLGGMSEFYNLTISGFSGNTRDSLKSHNHHRFSAKNLDLDAYNNNCAELRQAAWWYTQCDESNLNGQYSGSGDAGVQWDGFGNSRKTTMKIRPVQ